MFVRYQTVRNILIAIVAVTAVALLAWQLFFRKAGQNPPAEEKKPPAKLSKLPTPQRPLFKPAPRPPVPHSATLPDYKAVVTLFTRPASGKKVKDALGSKGPKVNLYDDDGDGKFDRAKIDIDRDGVWDETWTRKSNRLKRKLIKSGRILKWSDGKWVDKPTK